MSICICCVEVCVQYRGVCVQCRGVFVCVSSVEGMYVSIVEVCVCPV